MRFKKEYSFDEKKDAEYIIEHGFSEGKINYGDVQKVAKYFRNVSGFGAVRLEREIIKFCKEQDSDFNPIIERESIKKWVKSAMTNTLRKIDEIVITHYEMDKIKTVTNLKHRKLLFATLVLAKAIKKGKTGINKKETVSDKYYIQYDKLLDIIRLSKVQMTEIQLCDIFYEFGQQGLLTFYNPEKELILLNFTNDDDKKAITITDPNQFLEYYKVYFGGDMINCSVCGKEIVKNSNSRTMCEDCAKEKTKQRKAQWIKNKRNVDKTE